MKYGVYDNKTGILVLSSGTKNEANHLKNMLYIQDKRDGCLEKGCYSVHVIPWIR